MPELPEVQTVAAQLAASIVGRTIQTVRLNRRDYVRRGARRLPTAAVGRRIGAVRRHGKWLMLDLRPRGRLVLHLGMSGRVTLEPADHELATHTHVVIGFRRPTEELRIRDPRRFGGVWFFDTSHDRRSARSTGKCGNNGRMAPGPRDRSRAARRPAPAPLDGDTPSNAERKSSLGANGDGIPPEMRRLGPDALDLRPADLRRLLARRRQIKALLLDQSVVSGLGNIYCDEALHRAGVHPTTRACVLSEAQVRRLTRSIRRTLRAAIRAGGTTFREYRAADGRPGWFQVQHRVYGREGRPCRRCGTPIRRTIAAGRSTHWCPVCQPEPKQP